VSGPLYRGAAAWARGERFPLAVHLAESPEETDFVTRNAGPFAEGWLARGIPLLNDPVHSPAFSPGRPPSPVEWLDSHGTLGPDTLCIHAIQLSAGDINVLAARGCAVSHCPLSNLRHHRQTAPVAALQQAGIRVGLGTDSVASVGRLDLFAEMAAAQRAAGLGDEEILRLATLEGARALGLEGEIGSLTPGKWGDVIAVTLPGPSAVRPAALPSAIVTVGRRGLLLTVLGGRIVHRT
jgi:5-methylthioadenosine/S-adenosylhomocysteine deaminase